VHGNTVSQFCLLIIPVYEKNICVAIWISTTTAALTIPIAEFTSCDELTANSPVNSAAQSRILQVMVSFPSRGHACHRFEMILPVHIIQGDDLRAVPPAHQLAYGHRVFDSHFAWHGTNATLPPDLSATLIRSSMPNPVSPPPWRLLNSYQSSTASS
jgi:hypothetical protein